MSGGRFDYIQNRLPDVAEHIENVIERNGKIKTNDEIKLESWHSLDWYEKYPEDLHHYKYPDEVIEEFKKGVEIIKKAFIYIQRIDWLLSDDDGEETFLERLNKELKKIQKSPK
jgi:hypothetical protein